MENKKRDWKELCEAASKELDPQRLLALVSELTQLLDEGPAKLPQSPRGRTNPARI